MRLAIQSRIKVEIVRSERTFWFVATTAITPIILTRGEKPPAEAWPAPGRPAS